MAGLDPLRLSARGPGAPWQERARRARILLRKLPLAFTVQRRHVLLYALRRVARGDLAGAARSLREVADRVLARATPRPPVELAAAAARFRTRAEPPAPLPEPVDVVVPVHDGMDVLPALFASLARDTGTRQRLIVVDDASADPAVRPWLERALADQPDAVLVCLDRNRGYAAAANRGAAEARGDFVLLNSDTEVPPGWIERLLAPIRRDPTVASATPFTNAGTICSFPAINEDNERFLGLPVDAIDAVFRRADPEGPAIELPTAVGFCTAIRREVVERIGLFDETAFGRGYGEENDWSMRAAALGYRHVLVPDLFVYHRHSASYGRETRRRQLEANLAEVARRHPRYFDLVHRFAAEDPPAPLRAFAALLAMAAASCAAPLLVVDHRYGGGADLYREHEVDRPALAAGRALLRVTYDTESGGWRLLARLGDERVELAFEAPDELLLLAEHVAVGEVFLNSVVTHEQPRAVLATSLEIAKRSGARLVVAMHDHYALCPSYTLLDDSGTFCDLPGPERCRRCLPANRHAARAAGRDLVGWRSAWADVLGAADEILCFSESSRALLERVHGPLGDRVTLRPHALPSLPARPLRLPREGRLHIGVAGALNEQKGLLLLGEMARIIEAEGRDADITVIGYVESDPGLRALRVTGRYERAELPDLLERHRIGVCFLPSIWPETFSYVAEELMRLGVPLCCFDLGAPAERVRGFARGRVLPRIDARVALDEIEAFWRAQKGAS